MSPSYPGLSLTALWGGMAAFALSGCSAPIWRTYSSPTGDYVVLMPGTPQQETIPFPIDNGPTLTLQGVHLKVQQAEYAVGYVELPSAVQVPAGQAQRVMTGMVQGFAQRSPDGKITEDTELQVNGYPCRQFQATGKTESSAVKMAGRICLAGRRLYQALTKSGTADKAFEENTSKFLTSFQITRKT